MVEITIKIKWKTVQEQEAAAIEAAKAVGIDTEALTGSLREFDQLRSGNIGRNIRNPTGTIEPALADIGGWSLRQVTDENGEVNRSLYSPGAISALGRQALKSTALGE